MDVIKYENWRAEENETIGLIADTWMFLKLAYLPWKLRFSANICFKNIKFPLGVPSGHRSSAKILCHSP